jgi:hypothetical protein
VVAALHLARSQCLKFGAAQLRKDAALMLTWILGYLLVGFIIYWLCTAMFGIDPDLPLTWQFAAIALWPLVVILAGYRTLAAQPISEIAMEAALHRHDAPPIHPNGHSARRRTVEHPTGQRNRR